MGGNKGTTKYSLSLNEFNAIQLTSMLLSKSAPVATEDKVVAADLGALSAGLHELLTRMAAKMITVISILG